MPDAREHPQRGHINDMVEYEDRGTHKHFAAFGFDPSRLVESKPRRIDQGSANLLSAPMLYEY